MTMNDPLHRAPEWVLPERGERVLCAVSGGLDSMCLLHMLGRWCAERGGAVAAAHFNHGLREPGAERDEAFVREVCARWGIPLTVGRGETRAAAEREGLSPEEAARMLRYAFLRGAAETEGCRRIYTAHHAGDNAETVLLNLVRGTGIRGLGGMEYCRDGICRPLLDMSRQELADYAAVYGIPHVEDETNADPDAAARNFLRLRVVPLLEELNPRAVEHISAAARRVREAESALEAEARRRTARAEVQEGRVSLSLDELNSAPAAVRPRVLLRLFDLLGVGRRDVGAVHLDALMKMAARPERGGESRLSLPHSTAARCCGRQLVLEIRPQLPTEAQLPPGRPIRWGDYTLALLDCREGEGIALRAARPDEPRAVTVGLCIPGARLTLPGARGGRSVKRLCLDRRISPEERDRLPAVYIQGRLAAVWRLGVDTEFLPEGEAVRFIKIIRHREADGYEERDGERYSEGSGHRGGAEAADYGAGRGSV